MWTLKMPDIYKIHAVQKISLIKHFTDDRIKKCKSLSRKLIGMEKQFLDYKLPEKHVTVAKTKF